MKNKRVNKTLNNYIEHKKEHEQRFSEIDRELKRKTQAHYIEMVKNEKSRPRRKKSERGYIRKEINRISKLNIMHLIKKMKVKVPKVINRVDAISESLKSIKFKKVNQVNLKKISQLISLEKIKKVVNLRKIGYKKSISIGLIGLIVIISAIALNNSLTAYKVFYGGDEIALVKDKESVLYILDIIDDKLGIIHGADIVIDEKSIKFEKTKRFNPKITSEDEILEYFTYINNVEAKSYALYVNDQKVAQFSSKKKVEDLIQEVQDQFVDKDNDKIEYEKIYFLENIEIKEENTAISNINDYKTALEYILKGTDEEKIHKIKKGENYWTIAEKYNIKATDLEEANPTINPNKLQIGQEISLIVPKPLLTVVTKEKQTYIEKIPFELAYENTSALYKGEQDVKLKGTKGEKEILAEVEKHNGIEISRVELESKVISQPKTQVVLVGTKEIPPLIGTGNFDNPVRGTLSSRFGVRWGSMHTGIDIAAKTGTTIRASDGGVVKFAGWSGNYGLLVKIDHGQNKMTYYAHCSKILVSVGDKIYQGQKIAEVGNTGRSTGPHLHFEVRVNGTAKNPLNYVNY